MEAFHRAAPGSSARSWDLAARRMSKNRSADRGPPPR
jgi:hypothetical protein